MSDPKKDKNKKFDFNDMDLQKFELTRKYDDDFTPADGVAWRDQIMLFIIAGFVATFIVWANIAQLDEVSRGDGKVVPSSEIQNIQSLEGGIIDEFLVKEGDEVKEGQVILRMHNVQAKSDLSASNQKYYGLLASVTRLQAEAYDKPLVFTDEMRQGAPESVTAEQNSYDANKRNQQEQINVLQAQQAQKQQEVAELEKRIADMSSVAKLSQEQRAMLAPMVDRGAAPKMELLKLDSDIAQQTSELNGLKLALPRTQSAAHEAAQKINETTSGFKAEAQKDLAEKTSELNVVKQTLSAYQDKSERTDIKSPVHGTVKDLKTTTVGGVARPGDTIMEIVPLEDKLVIEARILPRDIAFIHVGQKAIVRLSAFDFSIYGSIEGTVADVGADSTTTEKGDSYYRVRIKTDIKSLTKGGKQYDIIPGMQATVDIVTGEKSVMTYLLKPFIKASQTALRER